MNSKLSVLATIWACGNALRTIDLTQEEPAEEEASTALELIPGS
jgi:hypothetical protein